jgi:hypothetical protein
VVVPGSTAGSIPAVYEVESGWHRMNERTQKR